MTYARARLWLGICGVGTWVLLSLAALLFQLPQWAFDGWEPTPAADLAGLAAMLAAYVAVSLPFDALGGWILPEKFGRNVPPLGRFLAGWLRGAAVQGAVMIGCGAVLLTAARAGGPWAAVGAAAGLMLLLLALQERLAVLVGGLRPAPADTSPVRRTLERWGVLPPKLSVLAAGDPGFVGGPVGVPGFERVVVPESWLAGRLSPDAAAAQIARRVGVMSAGSRLRGVLAAMGWNLAGFALALQIPGADPATLAGLATLAAGFTLWSFLGLLLLPTVSRAGVYEADLFARRAGVPADLIARTAAEVDRFGDDEPARPGWIEAIFHPVPSVDNRLRHLGNGAHRPVGAWQAARTALFLSWACWGLLGRAVHCNSGRPQLWVLLPGD